MKVMKVVVMTDMIDFFLLIDIDMIDCRVTQNMAPSGIEKESQTPKQDGIQGFDDDDIKKCRWGGG